MSEGLGTILQLHALYFFRADGSSEQCPLSADAGDGEGSHNDPVAGDISHDVDKQERIERYVRMTIQNQAETRLAQSSAEKVCTFWLEPDQAPH